MIYHKKQFVTWSTTHAPPNASLEQHRHLSALDSFGILAFHHFVRILSEAAVECFSEVISPLLVEVRFWSVKSGRFLGTVHCVAKRRRLLPVTVTCDCDNMTLKNTTTLHIQRKHRNGSASTFLQSWRAVRRRDSDCKGGGTLGDNRRQTHATWRRALHKSRF